MKNIVSKFIQINEDGFEINFSIKCPEQSDLKELYDEIKDEFLGITGLMLILDECKSKIKLTGFHQAIEG